MADDKKWGPPPKTYLELLGPERYAYWDRMISGMTEQAFRHAFGESALAFRDAFTKEQVWRNMGVLT